ncbi:MAG: LysM peptidoglycan-binding domain-containing protein [Anaerolineales bacterium]
MRAHIRLMTVAVLAAIMLFATAGIAAADAQIHVVQPGETLFRISVNYGVSMDAIRAANGISGDRIYSGQSLIIPDGSAPASPPPAPASGGVHVVQAGETLFTIGLKYGLTWTRIQAANGLVGTTVYVGQRLIIPGADITTTPPVDTPPVDNPPADPPPSDPPTGAETIHIVQRGDTLFKISVRYGVSWLAIQQVNHIAGTVIFVGERLIIPGAGTVVDTPPAADPPPADTGGGTGKRFVVVLSQQMLYAYEGETLVRSTLISSGTWQFPTVLGTYHIYARYVSARMRGPGYDLPNVPYVMYFYQGYGLHGTYWHNNFGHPMSHGCVNMPTDEAEWAFNWSTFGTPVIVLP